MKSTKSTPENNQAASQLDAVKQEKKNETLEKEGLTVLQGGKGHEYTYSKTSDLE